MIPFPEHAVHKTVPLRFAGFDLQLKASHALFSHHHVDDGTMLLLKTLAQQPHVPREGRVLDAGCGYGPLALSLKKASPNREVWARDRLALAAAFTAENARLNRVTVNVGVGLLLEDEGPWDLIVSNLPAKAGEPVLADFIPRSLALCRPGALVAVVIVDTLAPWFRQRLEAERAQILHEETGPGYQVFHYGPQGIVAAPEPAFPGKYQRSVVSWSAGARTFRQKTFFGLPNFDGLDYRTQVTLPLLETVQLRGDTLVWEPVQGHLASWVEAQRTEGTLHMAGNDLLGLKASQQNVQRSVVHPAPTLGGLDFGPGSLGVALVQVHSEPHVPWVEEMRDSLTRWLAPGGFLLINGTSTDLTRFLERHRGLRVLRDERLRGWRAALLVRQPSQ